jgi:iron transport multicopper oxidase
MFSPTNVNVLPPFPESGLLNDSTANVTLKFEPGKTYKVRVINMGALASTMLQFDSHDMTIIEVDGEYVKKQDTQQIRVSPAQRYSFLLEAKGDSRDKYAFLAAFDINRDFTQPNSSWQLNVTGYIEYDSENESTKTVTVPGPYVVHNWDPLDDFTLEVSPDLFLGEVGGSHIEHNETNLFQAYNNQQLLQSPDKRITLDFKFGFDKLGIPRQETLL